MPLLHLTCENVSCFESDQCCVHAGPASSFLVISDPAAAKHVLRASDNPKTPIYDKGLVAEVTSYHSLHAHTHMDGPPDTISRHIWTLSGFAL